MNDLEHDLRELFEQRASDVDVPGLAPQPVLKRVRRRQVGTVVTGVLACLAALGIAAAAIGQARHPAVIPMGNGLPARTTSIGGIPVTAPAGWTLVDDWPLASVIATSSETCSGSGTATPVEATGSSGDGNSASSGTDGSKSSSQSCTPSTLALPAGVPVFQLANFQIPLMQSVCGTGDVLDHATVPNDGVAIYVGAFPSEVQTQTLLDSCPGSHTVPDGPSVETFADTNAQAAYAGVIVAGPAASSDDIATAQDYLKSLGGIQVALTAAQVGPGPGYVMASGGAGGTSWRLEAGVTSLDAANSGPGAGAILVTETDSKTEAQTVDLPTHGPTADDAVTLGDTNVMQFGTATADVSAVDIALPSGGSVPATLLPWNLQNTFPTTFRGATGSIWFAETPERGKVLATVAAPSSSPTSSPTSGELTIDRRPNDGFVITGHDLGHDWRLESTGGRDLEFFLDGSNQPVGTLTDLIGNESQIDVDGGSFIISLRDPTVSSLSVTSGTTETAQPPATTIEGDWQRVQDFAGDEGRIWFIALPGSGSGLEQANDDLPTFVSWPSAPPLVQGSLISAASDGVVSWALTWQDDQCIILRTLSAEPAGSGPTNSGTSDCLHPWSDSTKPQVQLVNGATRSTVALIVSHQPATVATSPDLPKGALQCTDIEIPSTFAGSTICVFPVDDQQRVEVDLEQAGKQLRPVVVRKDGLSTSVS